MKHFLSFFFLAIGIWLVGGILGCLFPYYIVESQGVSWTEYNDLFLKIGTRQIIISNLIVITTALLGFFTAGITSTFILLINGFICIFCLKSILPFDFNLLNKLGIRCYYIIFECLAIWISSTLGLMGLPHIIKLFTGSRLHISVKDLILIVIAYLISIVLIVVAGWLEGSAITMLK